MATFTSYPSCIVVSFGIENSIVLHRDGMEAVRSAMAGAPKKFHDETGKGYHVARTPRGLIFAGDLAGVFELTEIEAVKLEDAIDAV